MEQPIIAPLFLANPQAGYYTSNHIVQFVPFDGIILLSYFEVFLSHMLNKSESGRHHSINNKFIWNKKVLKTAVLSTCTPKTYNNKQIRFFWRSESFNVWFLVICTLFSNVRGTYHCKETLIQFNLKPLEEIKGFTKKLMKTRSLSKLIVWSKCLLHNSRKRHISQTIM